eukprot:bmy_08619T0
MEMPEGRDFSRVLGCRRDEHHQMALKEKMKEINIPFFGQRTKLDVGRSLKCRSPSGPEAFSLRELNYLAHTERQSLAWNPGNQKVAVVEMNNVPNSFNTFEMLNRLKYKESNIFVDIWFIENLQQEGRGEFNIRLGEMAAAVTGAALLRSGVRYLFWSPSGSVLLSTIISQLRIEKFDSNCGLFYRRIYKPQTSIKNISHIDRAIIGTSIMNLAYMSSAIAGSPFYYR